MADKKKNASRPTQTSRSGLKTSEKSLPVKSISEMAHDEKDGKGQTKQESSAVKSISAMARDERKDGKERTKQESRAPKVLSATTRAEQQRDRGRQESRVRRETKEPSWLMRLRNSRVGRFVYDSYYELRYKVTWPTFQEARNMTIVVIVLSAVLAAIIAAVDYGLYNLFLLISR